MIQTLDQRDELISARAVKAPANAEIEMSEV